MKRGKRRRVESLKRAGVSVSKMILEEREESEQRLMADLAENRQTLVGY